MNPLLVVGGGPAGAAAAIAARLEGIPVRLIDRATATRHKVCGEFLSPDIPLVLNSLGIPLPPASCVIRRCTLHFARTSKSWILAESARGLSRYCFDSLLIEKASDLGAAIARGERYDGESAPVVLAYGRAQQPNSTDRLFGFKTHFVGPQHDTIELFLCGRMYTGVSGIEDRLTNVCGLAPESLLRRYNFDFDALVREHSPALADRLRPIERTMEWLTTGPLSFTTPAAQRPADGVYPAGDALAFLDPFTGSGILNALLSGRLAGQCAARKVSSAEYLAQCRSLFSRTFAVSGVLRYLLSRPEVHWLAPLLPGNAVFHATRPKFAL